MGHDACQRPGVKDIEGLVPTSLAYPFHPNERGEQVMVARVLATLRSSASGYFTTWVPGSTAIWVRRHGDHECQIQHIGRSFRPDRCWTISAVSWRLVLCRRR